MARTKRKAAKVRPREHAGGNPHDGLFHLAFSVPRHAASELKHILDADLVARIKWDKLRAAPGKFVDSKLTSRHSDLLFQVEIDGEEAFIYVLVEHKCEPEKWTLLQILEYMVRIWRTYLQEAGDKPPKRLPLILPVVVHHGAQGWTAPRRFSEYLGALNDSLRAYVPDFGIVLDDVGRVDPGKLLGRPLTPEAKLVLLCLALGREPQTFFAVLRKHPEALQGTWSGTDENLVIGGMLMYMERVGGIAQEETRMTLQEILKLSPAEQVIRGHEILMLRAKESGMKLGEKLGEKRGEKRGEIEEARALTAKLITHRFGPLTVEVTNRLQTATKVELEEMALRVLTAKTMSEVLGKPKRGRK